MKANCDDCMRGPSMIDGHAGLTVRSMGKAGMTFTCRHCDLVWSRSYSTTGEYEWTRQADPVAAARVGVVLPTARREMATVVAAAGIEGAALDHWLAIQRSWKSPRRDPQ